jgi:CheY-like chemotaxis protein
VRIPSVLVVDDDAPIRISLSIVLSAVGYRVRSAMDGFSALTEMRQELPDVLLSDLNMPRMSGFELLSVVRRRFPAVQVIAMSSVSFEAEADPLTCVAADAFHEKGSSLLMLIRKLEAMVGGSERFRSDAGTPVQVPRIGQGAREMTSVMLNCPECLQAFSHLLIRADSLVHHADCAHCRSVVPYAIVQNAVGLQRGDATRVLAKAEVVEAWME